MSGRQRYQWWVLSLPLLLVAGVLVWWILAEGGQQAESPRTANPSATSSTDAQSGLPIVQVGDLPPEAAQILELIDRGGPFAEDEDGGTFQNREEILPDQQLGYYQEYTVPTPGSEDRGARRIVVGDGAELYWTADHYRTFSRIAR